MVADLRIDTILLESYTKVEYTVDDPPREMERGKYYPITIHDVRLHSKSILGLLDVSQILLLQRRIYHKLLHEGDVDVIPSQ